MKINIKPKGKVYHKNSIIQLDYALVTAAYIFLILIAMVGLSPWWFLALYLWHWNCLWEDHKEHKGVEHLWSGMWFKDD